MLDDPHGNVGIGEVPFEVGLRIVPSAPPAQHVRHFAPAQEEREVGAGRGAEMI